jgi:hypothetical protein
VQPVPSTIASPNRGKGTTAPAGRRIYKWFGNFSKEVTRMLSYLNLTPHEITIIRADGSEMVLPPSGQVARVEMARETVVGPDGIECHVSVPGPVEGLPFPEEGVVLIVSALVRTQSYLRDRDDIASPGPLVRDDKGQPVGCQGLEYNSIPRHSGSRPCNCGSGHAWDRCPGGEILGSAYCG